jgi:hypothetical protein
MSGFRWTIVTASALASSCSGTLPQPVRTSPPAEAYVRVPYPPPPARVETVPKRPDKPSVWIDGQWTWDGLEYRWVSGGWVALPASGVRFSPWDVRIRADGSFEFAAAAWRDGSGRALPSPPVLEPAVGASSRTAEPVECR